MSSPRLLRSSLEAAQVQHVVDDLEREAEASNRRPSASDCASVPPPMSAAMRASAPAGTGRLQPVHGEHAPLEQRAVAALDDVGHHPREAVDVERLAGVRRAHRLEVRLVDADAAASRSSPEVTAGICARK